MIGRSVNVAWLFRSDRLIASPLIPSVSGKPGFATKVAKFSDKTIAYAEVPIRVGPAGGVSEAKRRARRCNIMRPVRSIL